MKTTFYTAILFLLLTVSCKKQPEIVGPPKVNDSISNSGFEADQKETGEASGWLTSGTETDADNVVSGGYKGSYALRHEKPSAYQVRTYQELTGLKNGFYKLTAFIQSSGGQNACYLSGTPGDGIERMTSLPVSTTWTMVVIRGIQVTNGTCSINIYSDANAGNWCMIDDVAFVEDNLPYTFLKGGDVSELSYIESKGGKFFENGIEKDCFEILKNNGFNIARLRLYNDPGNPDFSPSKYLPAGFQNQEDILNLAQRAKAAGIQIELTFHYSDYWTNGSTQTKPHEWANLNYEDLKKAVYDFTLSFMNQMKDQGTTPEYISLGNETPGGFLFPDGDYNHFNQMAELFNKGYDAVKSVAPDSKVIIHLDDAGNSGLYDWFFGELTAAGGKYDIVGASYYPFWSGKTVTQMRDWANYESAKLGREILIMETGYNWNPTLPNGSGGQLGNNGPYQNIYPSSPEGQRDFLLELFNGIKTADNGQVIGDIYWDPVMIAVPGVGWQLGAPNVVANTTLFDFNGNALVSLNAFKYNN
ncbi:MAG: glycosyl hydrolase 53 family protein [Chitinophagales bacterium]